MEFRQGCCIFYSEGVKKKRTVYEEICRTYIGKCGQILSQISAEGMHPAGSDADLVLITERENTEIHVENRKSNLDYTIMKGNSWKEKFRW